MTYRAKRPAPDVSVAAPADLLARLASGLWPLAL